PDEADSGVPVARERPVLRRQRVRAADLAGLLPRRLHEETKASLPLESHALLVELPDREHVPVHLQQVLLAEVWFNFRIETAVRPDYLEHFQFDRARLARPIFSDR